MKKRRSGVCLLAALLMVMMSLPLSAVVQAWEGYTPLTAVNVKVDAPVGGREVHYDASCSAAPVPNGAMINVNYAGSYFYHGLRWYDLTDEVHLNEGDTFITGHCYRVRVVVRVSNPAYFNFDSDVVVTFNGEAATITKHNSHQFDVAYEFSACAQAPADVSHVSIHNLSYPVAGRYAEYDAVTGDSLAYEVIPVNNEYFINGVAWYNQNLMAMRDDMAFKEGETYQCIVQLRVKTPYRFAVDANGLSTMTADIMGVPAEVYSPYQNNDNMESVVSLRAYFDCATAEQFHDAIDNVKVFSEYPVGGKTASFKAEVSATSYYIDEEQVTDPHMVNGVSWYDRTTGQYLTKGSEFQKGHEYTFSTVVRSANTMNTEYWFSAVGLGDGTAVSCVDGYVNTAPARIEPFGDLSVAQMLRVSVDYPACGDSAMTINRITLKNVDLPVEGRTPDQTGVLEFGYAEDGVLPTTKSVKLTWTKKTEGEMLPDETFEAGMPYGGYLELESGLLADFALNEQGEFDGNVIAEGSYENYVTTYETSKALDIFITYIPMEEQPPVTKLDVVGLIPPAVGEHPRYDVQFTQDSLPFVGDVSVIWCNGNDEVMDETDTFEAGDIYHVKILVSTKYPYEFSVTSNGWHQVTATVNGKSAAVLSTNEPTKDIRLQYVFDTLTATPSVIDYAEVDGIMRPAPGQTPDFTANINSAYAQFGGISWYEIGEDGKYASAALGVNDVFLEDTLYRAEIRLTAPSGKIFDLDSRNNYVNNEAAHYYYNSDSSVTMYIEYDTANCITDINFGDVQYPIGGKTPDDDYHVNYDNWYHDGMEWYYETNPGTSSAGFSLLDGKFKTDRRHQVYMEYTAPDGCWFATDRDGKLAVNATIDQREVDFVYATDMSYDNGICSSVEACETFELAKNVDGVFVDGMWLTDGLYLSDAEYGIFTEDNVEKSLGYAYYNDGVLYLCDFSRECWCDYDAIASYHPLTVSVEGENYMVSSGTGINTNGALTLTGEDNGELGVCASQYGVFAMDTVTVESGNWSFEAIVYDGIWLYDDLTVNGGFAVFEGKSSGIYGDDWPTVYVNGGTVYGISDKYDAIGWCNVQMPADAKVQVALYGDEEMSDWDGVTDFGEYCCVSIAVAGEEPDVLKGDVDGNGDVDIYDALRLFKHVNEELTLEGSELAAGDVDGNGDVDIYDALRLFKFVNEEIDAL